MAELEELEKLFATADNEGKCFDGRLALANNKCPQLHIAKLAAVPCRVGELGCRRSCGPWQRGIRCCETEESENQTNAFESVRVLLFEARLQTWVWHAPHAVVQKLILTTRSVGRRSWQQMAKRCRASRCISEFTRKRGI